MCNRFTALLLILFIFSLTACSWVGETAGRAKAGMENSMQDTKTGYKKGYKEGKKEEDKKEEGKQEESK